MTQLSETEIRQWRSDALSDTALSVQMLKDQVLTLSTALLTERTRKPDNLSRVVMANRPALTRQQLRVMKAILDYTEANRIAPTFREIGELVRLKSRGNVHKHIAALVEKGFAVTEWHKQRSVRVLERVE